MATIHPSRMAHIPAASRDVRREFDSQHIHSRSPPRSRSKSPYRNGSASERRDRYGREERDREQFRGRENANGDRSRREPARDHDRSHRAESPDYSDYRKPRSPRDEGQTQGTSRDSEQAPWRKTENMYPNRRADWDRDGHDAWRGGGRGAGADFLERCGILTR
jgi:hypothetical protein